ncbi:MAG: alpha/beta hydrolase [Vicinamibacterales bacterium]
MRRWILRGVLVPLGIVFILWAMRWEPVYWAAIPFVYRETTLPPERTISDIAYDPSAPTDPKRQLDLFLPSAPDFSAVVFVHGGGWTTGDRSLTSGGADVYRNIGRFLAARGFATAVISYRRLFDVDWRTQAADVARAVAFVQKSIDARGARPGAVFLMGHSAGAQLATRVALEPEWLANAGGDVAGVCGVIAASGAGYDMSDDETYKLGADPAYYADRWGAGVLNGAWRRDASPVTHLSANAPPFLVLYAEGDIPPLRHQAALLAQRLLRAGIAAREVVIPGSSHERVVVQLRRDDQTAGPALLSFLQATTCPRR